ncbi:uncharacterized protein LOC116398726 [Anarrhichthys ocellatus]|uniref:uncharacterized protein LOC116398726 n=1 Tax=Anarrhichthys ocellatus TaxID=433405 RepID=UPI0012EDE5F7|nr:uncharacterized protein LOC116398726 [Anarrhichthys ocellatus]
MRRSTMELPPTIEKWTKEDVHQWLMTVVKVQETYADKFCEEDVSGDSFVFFEKKDILDLGINHGPAVKIKFYLESLKEGQHESQFPPYVKNWTKEEVNQWLLQHVNIYSKYAERLQEEDVSGDCLVCFKKQDFLELDLKNGPAVKILAELHQLRNKPEPTLQPILHTTTDQKEFPKPTQPELGLAQALAIKQPNFYYKTESKTDKMVKKESEKAQLPFQKVSEKEGIQQPKPQDLGARRKGAIVTTDISKITVEIQKILANLYEADLKDFQFYLQEYGAPEHEHIPRGKLEGKDIIDTTTLMTDHYGSKEALQVTIDILKEINQRELAHQLEKNMGKTTNANMYSIWEVALI